MAKRRPLTEEEVRAANKLKQAWLGSKKRLGLNQEEAAHKIGMTQGGFSHYINAQVPLNINALLDICSLIEANPREIYPEITSTLQSSTPSERLQQLFNGLNDDQQSLIIKEMEEFNELNSLRKLPNL